ncbi:serine/threonine-protein phosphatase 7 long form-like protein [Gossypium australe]|uniref:Serine/threonine-protein phosphatase 7 long form-like protein n=1 Tax=Gossypium australe TaxID=47621 RepID=A0A5B6VKL7_9ROSI|nr:serine/threonine-protein phosphatase 7 long form-like protein [Gossypium australe]
MPDKFRNLVHVRWLLHLANFNECVKLSWGSTTLSTLYQELCHATQPDNMSIGVVGLVANIVSISQSDRPISYANLKIIYSILSKVLPIERCGT